MRSFLAVLLALREVTTEQLSYDTIILKFDPKCEVQRTMSYAEYLRTQKRPLSTTERIGVAALEALVNTELQTEFLALQSNVDWDSRTAARLLLPDSEAVSVAALTGNTSFVDMKLGEVPSDRREDYLLSILRLMAVADVVHHPGQSVEQLVQSATAFLEAERAGDVEGVISAFNSGRQLRRRLQDAATTAAPAEEEEEEDEIHLLRSKLIKAREKGGRRSQFFVTPRSLEYLEGMKLIRNPIMGKQLAKIASQLPCLEIPPHPDRYDEQKERSPFVSAESSWTHTPPGGLVPVEILDYETLKARLHEEEENGYTKPSFIPTKSNQTFYLRYPEDVRVSESWHFLTPGGHYGEVYGAGIDSGWANLIKEVEFARNPDLIHEPTVVLNLTTLMEKEYASGLSTVVVFDTGCSRHSDLVDQFWRNPEVPGCEEGAYEGQSEHSEVLAWQNDCVGYDFSDNVPDPTLDPEVTEHGTAIAGVIAGRHNRDAIAGVCPFCEIVCLKLTSARGGAFVLSVILHAIDYVMAHRGWLITNHSYGNYRGYIGPSDPEKKAHVLLANSDRFVIAEAGDHNCDIHPDSAENCRGPGWTMTPAGLPMFHIMTVGASNRAGELFFGSNYGPSIDVYAPGDQVPALIGEHGSLTASGSGISTAIATGVVALIKHRIPNLSALELKSIIEQSAVPVGGGRRIINLQRALVLSDHFREEQQDTDNLGGTNESAAPPFWLLPTLLYIAVA